MNVISGPGEQAIGLALEHRTPEDYADRPVSPGIAGLLSGLLVEIPRGCSPEDEEDAAAVMTIRRVHNKHGCTQFGPGDPECTHMRHYQDVAMMQDALRKCFSDQSPGLRYLAESWKRKRKQPS
jgi:hypothetical protein